MRPEGAPYTRRRTGLRHGGWKPGPFLDDGTFREGSQEWNRRRNGRGELEGPPRPLFQQPPNSMAGTRAPGPMVMEPTWLSRSP